MGSTHATVLRRLLWSGETGVRRGGRGCGTLTAGWLVCSYSLSGSVRIGFLTIISFWPKNIQCTSTCIYIQKSYIIVRFLYALETPHWKALNLHHSDMCVIIGRLITPPHPLPPPPPLPPSPSPPHRGYMVRFEKCGRSREGDVVYLLSAVWFNKWRERHNYQASSMQGEASALITPHWKELRS